METCEPTRHRLCHRQVCGQQLTCGLQGTDATNSGGGDGRFLHRWISCLERPSATSLCPCHRDHAAFDGLARAAGPRQNQSSNIDSKIGSASGRERVCHYASLSEGAVYINKKKYSINYIYTLK